MAAGAPAAAPPDKRDRILRAAVRIFAKKGFYGARVSEIAKAARIADGTVYLYFKSKDEILLSLFNDRFEMLIRALVAELARQRDPIAKIRRMIELQLGLLEGHRELAEVLTVNLRHSAQFLRRHAGPRFVQYLDVLSGVVAEGQKAGVFRRDVSARIVARALFGALDGLALTWALGDARPGEMIRAGKELSEVMLGGLVAPGHKKNGGSR